MMMMTPGKQNFSRRTVGYLDENLDVPGVITWSNRIDEILEE